MIASNDQVSLLSSMSTITGMDVRALEVFTVLAEELHFGRAAQRLHLVQSSVSASVAALERELGATLFVRTRRSVALSEAGRLALSDARAALLAVERMRLAVDETGSGLRGRVRLGVLAAVQAIDVPTALARFGRSHPRIELEMRVSPAGSTGLVADLNAGRLDIALVALPETELAGLALHPVLECGYVAVLPEDSPLAARDVLELADLAGLPFLDSPLGFANRLCIDRAFTEHGLARHVRAEVAEVPSIPGYVAAGLGVAIVPALLVTPTAGVVTVPVREPGLWRVQVATTRTPSPAGAALVEALLAVDPV
jgi:DNA-binding transcriptional LysR family regulator